MNVNSLGETARTHCPKAAEVHSCFRSFILVLNFGKGVISIDQKTSSKGSGETVRMRKLV